MKIILQCPICKDHYAKNDLKIFGTEYRIIYNSDTSISLIDDSPRGHFSVVYFTNYKFDLLFESGLSAIHDLYLREAVASIASSLERFYEYCIEILTFNLDQNRYDKLWKSISNQSERQIGAFFFLYFKTFNNLPDFLSNDETSFRNKVIHKGYFPTEDETINFSKRVYQIIKNNYDKMFEAENDVLLKHFKLYEQNLHRDASIFATNKSKEYKKYKEYKFNTDPFKRNIDTFLFTEGNFKKENLKNILSYINSLEYKQLD
ncbi:hypothetical protein ACV0BM_011590 [Elizabethkingia meningoseptica]